jgi:pilus assembly protein CpaB
VNTRRITLIVAVLLAVGTGVLTLRYLSSINQGQTPTQAVESKPVLIANRDIPARGKITPDMLTRVSRPANQVEPGALSDPKEAEGDVALIAIPANSTITESKVGHPAEVGVTARLTPGMRAVTIPVDRVKAVSGLIEPGNRVDVMASVPRGANSPPRTFAIIRGALVLAVNEELEGQSNASPAPESEVPSLVTLAVTPQQAELLTSADLNTTLRLALRSSTEPVRSLPAEDLEYPQASVPAPAAQPNVPPPASFAKAPAPGNLVTVIDGDKIMSGGR